MKDVVLATISAPTFFEPYVIESKDLSVLKHLVFADGALSASNPAMCAYVEAKTLFPDVHEYLIVSLGTGKHTATVLHELTKGWGAVQWIKPLVNIMLSGAVDVVDHQLKTLFATPGDRLNHYYRFQIQLEESKATMDDAGEISLHVLELLAENLIRDNHHEIEQLCEKLVK